MPWLMGLGVGLVNEVRPAAELVERMMREAHAILKRLGQSLGEAPTPLTVDRSAERDFHRAIAALLAPGGRFAGLGGGLAPGEARQETAESGDPLGDGESAE